MSEGKVCPLPGAAGSFPMPCVPGWPKLRAGTQLDAIYERMLREGNGFVRPGSNPDNPQVVAVFDPQCYWSNNFWKTSRLLENDVHFIWYPVCVSADYSTAQAASILAAADPWSVFCEHEESFADPDFCGIHAEDYPATQEDRNRVWNNARIFRKSGGTQVPLGIFRKPDGTFVPLFGDNTAEEMRRVIGI